MSDFWSGRVVLVTGATGLLGSWLTQALVDQGADVVCLIRDWVPQSNLFAQKLESSTKIVAGELENQRLLERLLNEYSVDTVFHLAAQTIVGTANRSPVSTFEANIRGTWSLLEACRLSPWVRQIVVASSDKAYGEQPVLPYTESTPLEGRHPYDVSKSCADLIAQSYAHTFGLPVCVTRCGNLFGGGDLNFNRLIPGVILSALCGDRPIIRSNGRSIRDYFYVEDAVDAYLTLARQMAENRSLAGHAFNFGSHRPMSALEMVEAVLGAMAVDLSPVILNNATHEIPDQHLDCSKARLVLGWQSSVLLPDALDRTIAWYRKQMPCQQKGGSHWSPPSHREGGFMIEPAIDPIAG